MSASPTLPPLEFIPQERGSFPGSAEHTIFVTIRKEGGKYVADPKRIRVPEKCTNIVFALQDAPANARLIKIKIREPNPKEPNPPNPFSDPQPYRVMLVTDDNSNPKHQKRKFEYDLVVHEGMQAFVVDPGIDNDPPGP